MAEDRDFTQCRKCKYFVEDDDSLKTVIEYCIILGANLDTSGHCPEFVALKKDADAELVG
ncbi:hypothetical protein [Spirochaeta isovalerica]|uniref:Uncharacterized protein n=1 Tax=Spirochaeta isovalerica TaxID=150 RepID=A0A841RDB7_9SPIO|nr:hypothetical protein [Spirochaeta isovalerica]MBB6481636.1 hypothetical protein [Spirochaeta isovalerica]